MLSLYPRVCTVATQSLVRRLPTKFGSARKTKKKGVSPEKFRLISISFLLPMPEELIMFCTSGGVVTGLQSLVPEDWSL